jgi:hypothetical protein
VSSSIEDGPLLELLKLSRDPSLGRMDVGAEKLGGVEGQGSQAVGWREGEGRWRMERSCW